MDAAAVRFNQLVSVVRQQVKELGPQGLAALQRLEIRIPKADEQRMSRAQFRTGQAPRRRKGR
jgi:hypothetical protein